MLTSSAAYNINIIVVNEVTRGLPARRLTNTEEDTELIAKSH
jgi:hypothetical protein